jgi:hypothetical protein
MASALPDVLAPSHKRVDAGQLVFYPGLVLVKRTLEFNTAVSSRK